MLANVAGPCSQQLEATSLLGLQLRAQRAQVNGGCRLAATAAAAAAKLSLAPPRLGRSLLWPPAECKQQRPKSAGPQQRASSRFAFVAAAISPAAV